MGKRNKVTEVTGYSGEKVMAAQKRYDNLDGLRAISCIGIIGMHVQANSSFHIHGYLYDTVIPSMTLLVYLFIMISGFGMFCGYYKRFKSGEINLNSFYARRYKKILPFFAVLIAIDVLIEHSLSHLIEGLTELTLVFGLLPNNQPSVIGVCWTIGVIFLFYMIFPFFVYLCWNKKRAWIAFGISLVLNIFCSKYYFTSKFVTDSFAPRHSFLYCAPYFLGGALLYLYRENIEELGHKIRTFFPLLLLFCIVFFYAVVIPRSDYNDMMSLPLIFCIPAMLVAIGTPNRILNNRVMSYFSGISMEMYLAQMVVFRAVEKMRLERMFGNGGGTFIITWVITVLGLVVLIEVLKKLQRCIKKLSLNK